MRRPEEPVSTRTSSIVAQVDVLGWHSVTLTYGMLKVPPLAAGGPDPTVTLTTLAVAAPLELLLELLVELPLELLELLEELLLVLLELLELLAVLGLLLPPPPPPPHPAIRHAPSHTIQRTRWFMHQSRYGSPVTDTPAGTRLGT